MHNSGQKMRLKPVWLTAGVMLAVMAGVQGCAKKANGDNSAASHAATVNYAVVQQVSAPVHITGSGSISAWQEVPVGAETGGLTAVALLADEGQTVTQGQPLLKMNDVLLQAQLKQASANYDQANKAYQRAETLYKQGYLSAAGLDQAQASMLTTQAALETAQTQLSLATVRAPVAGVVTSRKAVLGQIVQQGAELFRIVRDARIELNMQVVESDLHAIKPGMSAVVTSESTGPVNGTVRIVTPEVDPDTRLGMARISVPWASGLRPGMFAQGSIDAGLQSVMEVPQTAIVYSENKPAVYYISADNKVHLRKVTLGDHVGNNVVLKDAVAPGDRVVTTGAGFLNDGDTVKPVAAASGSETAGG